MSEKIENNFMYHAPTEAQVELMQRIRAEAKQLAYSIELYCPVSREQSLAWTKLEEMVMWANAAIVRNKPTSQSFVVEAKP